MVKYREILRQKALGASIRNIAFSCKCSTTTVQVVLDRAKAQGLVWPVPEEMTDEAIRQAIYPKKPKTDRTKAAIDHEYIARELTRPGVTMTVLWQEYCESCSGTDKEPYMYSAFCSKHREWAAANNVVMHIEHRPGQTMQVDWAGMTMQVVDLDTAEIYKVYVFVACLPFSAKLYAEGFYNMKEQAWIEAHVHSFSYFGGVTAVVVPDNCRQAISKHSFDELVINEHYRRMAEYYGCAVVPTRPRKPRDKAAVEMGVRVVEQTAIAPLRNHTFHSLSELNEALLKLVEHINCRPFQKREGSRNEVFIRQEKPALASLPSKPYEIVTRRKATVNFNYHVSFEGMWYSVPFSYVKREVEICATKTSVWVICDGCRIAFHSRLLGPKGAYSTLPEHMPQSHRDYVQWDAKRFLRWASEIGPSCVQVVEAILKSRPVEQQSYRSCRALLGLAQKYTKDSLEQACYKALSYTTRPSYKTVKSIISQIGSFQTDNPHEGAYLRGKDYYQNLEQKRILRCVLVVLPSISSMH